MTPRKELFIAIKTALAAIPELELVDLYRKQFQSDFPNEWPAALIRIGAVRWTTMTEQKQEGSCDVEVILYCKDGWMDQHQDTADPDHGLIEIDLIDSIAESLQFLSGDQFKPLQQTTDGEFEVELPGIMAYSVGFSTHIYRRLAPKYTNTQLNLKAGIHVSI